MIIKRGTSCNDKSKKFKWRKLKQEKNKNDNGDNSLKHKGGENMAVLARSNSCSFIVDKDKAEEFLSRKRDKSILNKILEKAKLIEKNEIK